MQRFVVTALVSVLASGIRLQQGFDIPDISLPESGDLEVVENAELEVAQAAPEAAGFEVPDISLPASEDLEVNENAELEVAQAAPEAVEDAAAEAAPEAVEAAPEVAEAAPEVADDAEAEDNLENAITELTGADETLPASDDLEVNEAENVEVESAPTQEETRAETLSRVESLVSQIKDKRNEFKSINNASSKGLRNTSNRTRQQTNKDRKDQRETVRSQIQNLRSQLVDAHLQARVLSMDVPENVDDLIVNEQEDGVNVEAQNVENQSQAEGEDADDVQVDDVDSSVLDEELDAIAQENGVSVSGAPEGEPLETPAGDELTITAQEDEVEVEAAIDQAAELEAEASEELEEATNRNRQATRKLAQAQQKEKQIARREVQVARWMERKSQGTTKNNGNRKNQ